MFPFSDGSTIASSDGSRRTSEYPEPSIVSGDHMRLSSTVSPTKNSG